VQPKPVMSFFDPKGGYGWGMVLRGSNVTWRSAAQVSLTPTVSYPANAVMVGAAPSATPYGGWGMPMGTVPAGPSYVSPSAAPMQAGPTLPAYGPPPAMAAGPTAAAPGSPGMGFVGEDEVR